MITREADYAIRIILNLAEGAEKKRPTTAIEMARAMDIPYRFLRRLIHPLRKAGLIETRRGNGGGMMLKIAADKISILDVLNIVNPAGATLNICLQDEGKCSRSGFCPVHEQMQKVQSAIDDQLKGLTFDKLLSS